jgi:deoxyribodipyrimidine photo-lyase
LNKQFDKFPWQINTAFLKAWQQGKTGYPIVDAGMRELWETGYMHNRVRMIVASFLVKNLLIDWRVGLEWFNNCLCDSDLANNTASWQWTAGSGADAAPYFRIFNPILQGKKFDPDGSYTKKYVPELKHLPKKYLFEPWEADDAILKESGIDYGVNYPKPIVSVADSRDIALQAFEKIKKITK